MVEHAKAKDNAEGDTSSEAWVVSIRAFYALNGPNTNGSVNVSASSFSHIRRWNNVFRFSARNLVELDAGRNGWTRRPNDDNDEEFFDSKRNIEI